MKKFKHPFSEENCVKRLLTEYAKHPELIVAFDFDNTIYDTHSNGGDYSDVWELLRQCHNLGFILVLYTVETNSEKLEWKRETAKNILGFYPDYVNYSPIQSISNTQGKIYYNILLDDRAGLNESYSILSAVVENIESK